MLSITDYTYVHEVTGNDIWLEEYEIKEALCRGGYDTSDLHFEDAAIQAKVREVNIKVENLNIAVTGIHKTEPNHHGDFEIVLDVRSEADLAVLKLTLG
jgi:hypothetical protein